MTSDRQQDAPAGEEQLLRDLLCRRPGADHEQLALGQLPRVAVVARVQPRDAHVARPRGHAGPLERPRRDDHLLGLDRARRRLEPVALAVGRTTSSRGRNASGPSPA